jgi:nucleotide-binding universal stress UspA family protein
MMGALIAERPPAATHDMEQALPLPVHAARPLPHPMAAIAVVFAGGASSAAPLALAPAQSLAARLNADLVLIQVQSSDTDAGVDLLSRAVRLARCKGLAAQGRLVTVPAATPEKIAQAVLAAVRETAAGLLVIASAEAYAGVERDDSRSGPGRVVEAVVRLSPIPVLLVPPGYGAREGDGALRWIGWEDKTLAAARAGETLAPLRLVVALDGSPAATASLPLVSAWMRALGAEVSLVRVALRGAVLYGAPPSGTGRMSGVEAALAFVTRAALWLQGDGVAADAIRTAVRIGPVPDELLAQAGREQASILVLAQHPGSGSTSALADSVTAQVLRRAALPVLLVPTT